MQMETVALGSGGTAWLDVYLQEPELSHGRTVDRPLMVLCPGGGYVHHATKEREPVVFRFLGLGYHVVVVRYSLYLAGDTKPDAPVVNPTYTVDAPLEDLMAAMTWVRALPTSAGVDQARVYALGFSAGAHLVGRLAEEWDRPDLLEKVGATALETKPRGVLLGYPLVSAESLLTRPFEAYSAETAAQVPMIVRALFAGDPDEAARSPADLRAGVRPDMPRTFLWQTSNDSLLNAAETAQLVARCIEAGVPCEAHFFQTGPHGMALADRTTALREKDADAAVAQWVALASAWLDRDVDGAP